jgi:hypothetical protein
MLEVRGVIIASRLTPDDELPRKDGKDVADELGGRYLLRYMLPHQTGQFTNGSTARHYVTPTPYAPEETVTWLYLPKPDGERTFVMLFDPAKIPFILGPRWVRLGNGIEYILSEGFPKDAVVGGWELTVE